jgi:hypothetical protein
MSAPQAVRQPTRVSLSLGSTTQTGEFQFSKITIGLERDVASLENPLDAYRDINALLRKALQEITPPPKVSGPEKSLTSPPKTPNGLAQKDTSASSTPLEKTLDSLPWAPGKIPGREWIPIKDHAELKQTLALIQEKAVNGYYTIGGHVYRIEGDFLGRYPKRETAKT